MNIKELVRNKKLFSFHLNQKLEIEAISHDLFSSGGNVLIKQHIDIVLKGLFCNDEFCNQNYVDLLLKKLHSSFDTRQNIVEQIIVSDNNLKASFYYSFSLGIEMIMMEKPLLVLKFNNFEELVTKESFYHKLFKDIEETFEVFSSVEKISRFIIDYSQDNKLLFADHNFPVLLDRKKSESNYYELSDLNELVLRNGIKLLESNELATFTE